jgi:hypothetical protein
MQTVIVHGPKACGKTRNKEALRRKFRCMGVVDDFGWRRHNPLTRGFLHLSNESASHLEKITAGQDVEIVAFEDAMKGVEPA